MLVTAACTQAEASDDLAPTITVTTTELEPFNYFPDLTADDTESTAVGDTAVGDTAGGDTAVGGTAVGDAAVDDTEPVLSLDAVMAFADLAELDTVVALDDNTVQVAFLADDPDDPSSPPARAGATHDVAPLGWAWSDGDYVFQWVDVGNGTLESTVAEFDGTVICEADGSVHHFTPGDPETGDAAVISVEASPVDWDLPEPILAGGGESAEGEGAEFAIPLFDVDCETGESVVGESVSFQAEDGFRFTKTAGSRTFAGIRNTNGITDLIDSAGLAVNGDDAAIDHSFNASASLVAYGVFESDEDPSIVTDVIRMRAVDGGEVLWTAKLPFPFTFVHFSGDRLVVGQPDRGGRQGGASTTSIMIFDVRDATLLGHYAAPFEILSVGD